MRIVKQTDWPSDDPLSPLITLTARCICFMLIACSACISFTAFAFAIKAIRWALA